MKFIGKIFEWFIFLTLISLAFVVMSPILPSKKYLLTYIVSSGSMEPTIQTGSVAFVKPILANEIKKGDIVTFTSPKDINQTILHRIFKVDKSKNNLFFQTKGDDNNAPDNWKVSASGIRGKYFFSIPLLGHIAAFMKKPLGFILTIGVPAILLIFLQIKSIKEGIEEEVEKRTKKVLQDLKKNKI